MSHLNTTGRKTALVLVAALLLATTLVFAQPRRGELEHVRLLRGTVRADGAVVAGNGFSVARVSPGVYDIQFDRRFRDAPSVTATPVIAPPDPSNPEYPKIALSVYPINDIACRITAFVPASEFAGEPLRFDQDFCFIVAGPQ